MGWAPGRTATGAFLGGKRQGPLKIYPQEDHRTASEAARGVKLAMKVGWDSKTACVSLGCAVIS